MPDGLMSRKNLWGRREGPNQKKTTQENGETNSPPPSDQKASLKKKNTRSLVKGRFRVTLQQYQKFDIRGLKRKISPSLCLAPNSSERWEKAP